MSVVNITIKWNKETFNVPLDTSAPVSALKEQLQNLTNVPPSRQKLLAKGAWPGILKDDANFSTMKIPEGQVVMLMGTADSIVKPQEQIKFVEDMTVEEKVKHGNDLPLGINNLGNTCYLNSVVECLRYIPEFRKEITTLPTNSLPYLLHDFFRNLEEVGTNKSPFQFITALRNKFPQFAEMKNMGYAQQDSEEFFSTLLSTIPQNILEKFLSFELEETITCTESTEEKVIKKKEVVNKLICMIQGTTITSSSTALSSAFSTSISNPATAVDHLPQGLSLALQSTLTKHSEVLQRDALWQSVSRMSKLPQYFCIQFLRFFWKATPESNDRKGLKCKILRNVTFPQTLDIFPYCNEEIQEELLKRRNEARKKQDALIASKRSASQSSGEQENESKKETVTTDSATDSATVPVTKEEEDDLAAALALSLQDFSPNSLPANFTGHYELVSVVSHKGRSADSGHYMAYVRQYKDKNMFFDQIKGKNMHQDNFKEEEWWLFDDDKVSEVSLEDVLKLSGGGDRDMNYLCFYKMKLN